MYTSISAIIGGSTITFVNINCNKITETGHTMNNTFVARIQYNETQAITVTYNIWSDLDITSANVGKQVIWRMFFEVYTIVLPIPELVVTSQHGSSLFQTISHSFTPASGVAIATIDAFKFYRNINVFLYCWMTGCPTTSGCRTSCHNTQKRHWEGK